MTPIRTLGILICLFAPFVKLRDLIFELFEFAVISLNQVISLAYELVIGFFGQSPIIFSNLLF